MRSQANIHICFLPSGPIHFLACTIIFHFVASHCLLYHQALFTRCPQKAPVAAQNTNSVDISVAASHQLSYHLGNNPIETTVAPTHMIAHVITADAAIAGAA